MYTILRPVRHRTALIVALLLAVSTVAGVGIAAAQAPPGAPPGTISRPGVTVSMDVVAARLGVSGAELQAAVEAVLDAQPGASPSTQSGAMPSICIVQGPVTAGSAPNCTPVTCSYPSSTGPAAPPNCTIAQGSTQAPIQGSAGQRVDGPAPDTSAAGVAGVRLGDDFFDRVAARLGLGLTGAQVRAAFVESAPAQG